jgi:hypothetical protein
MGKIAYSCTILIISLSVIQAIRAPHLNNFHQTLIFVEQSSNKTSTSLGILGEGIESLSSDIHDLADQLNLSLKSLDSQIDASISITSKSSSALLSSQIQDRQHELARVNKMISEIEGNLAEYKGTCNDYSTCDGCVLSSSCLWCNDGQSCMPGDGSGPHSGHCNSWEYATCTQSGCGDHTDCEDCLANSECGWCQNGAYCLDGDPENTGECIKDFFYHAMSEGKDMCPASSSSSTRSNANSSDTYVNTKISTTSNEVIKEQEAQLKELKEYAAKLQSEIDQLQSSQNEIASESESATSIEISDIDIGEALTGLGKEVEDRYDQEREEDRAYMQEVAEDAASEVITNAYNKVEESSQIILDNQNQNKQEILDALAKYSQQAKDSYQKEKQDAAAQAEVEKQQAQAEAEAQQAQAQQNVEVQQTQEESSESPEQEIAESEAIVMGSDEDSEEHSDESGGDSSIEAEDGSEPVGDNQIVDGEETEESESTTDLESDTTEESDTTAVESESTTEESETTSEESESTSEESESTTEESPTESESTTEESESTTEESESTTEESESTTEESPTTSEESETTTEEESGDAENSDTSAVSALELHESRINNKFLS